MYNGVMLKLSALRPWQIVFGITLAGLFLRLVGFAQIPISLYWDEMAIWNDALSITQTGRDLFDRSWFQPIFLSYGDFKLPIIIWATALVSFFTRNPFIAVRLPSLLAGVSMIPAVYLLANKIPFLQKKEQSVFALLSAFVVAVLPWSLHFSKVGYEGHLGSAFLLWSLVFFFHAPRKKYEVFWFALSALFGVLSVYSYFSVRFVWPVVVLAATILFWKNFSRSWKGILFAFLLWGVSLLPMYKADFYNESNRYRLSAANVLDNKERVHEVNLWRERAGNTFVARAIYNEKTFLIRELAGQYLVYLDPSYLFLSGDPNLRHGTGRTGLLWLTFLPFVVVGFISLVKDNLRFFAWLAVWLVFAILPAAVPLDIPHALRSLNALPVWVFVTAFGFTKCVFWIAREKSSVLQKAWIVVVSLFLVAEIIRYFVIFLHVYPQQSQHEWQAGYIPLAQYVAQMQSQYDYVYVDAFDDRFFLYYLPYSGIAYSEIQKLPSQDFKREVFRNVFIQPVADWEFLEHNSLVIATPQEMPGDFVVVKTFFDASGKEQFVVAETEKNR